QGGKVRMVQGEGMADLREALAGARKVVGVEVESDEAPAGPGAAQQLDGMAGPAGRAVDDDGAGTHLQGRQHLVEEDRAVLALRRAACTRAHRKTTPGTAQGSQAFGRNGRATVYVNSPTPIRPTSPSRKVDSQLAPSGVSSAGGLGLRGAADGGAASWPNGPKGDGPGAGRGGTFDATGRADEPGFGADGRGGGTGEGAAERGAAAGRGAAGRLGASGRGGSAFVGVRGRDAG